MCRHLYRGRRPDAPWGQGVRPRELRAEPHREQSRAVADEARVVGQRGLRYGEFQFREAAEQLLKGDGGLHAGERRAEAVVRAVAQREVPGGGTAGGPGHVEPVGVGSVRGLVPPGGGVAA